MSSARALPLPPADHLRDLAQDRDRHQPVRQRHIQLLSSRRPSPPQPHVRSAIHLVKTKHDLRRGHHPGRDDLPPDGVRQGRQKHRQPPSLNPVIVCFNIPQRRLQPELLQRCRRPRARGPAGLREPGLHLHCHERVSTGSVVCGDVTSSGTVSAPQLFASNTLTVTNTSDFLDDLTPWKQPAPKVSKVKKPGDEKMPAEGQAAGGEGACLSGSPGSAEEADRAKPQCCFIGFEGNRRRPLEGRKRQKWRAC